MSFIIVTWVIPLKINDGILSMYPFVLFVSVCLSFPKMLDLSKNVIFQKAITGKCYNVELSKSLPNVYESIRISVSNIKSLQIKSG